MNIVLDFTVNKAIESLTAGQPLAVMPAELAKRLLRSYANTLQSRSVNSIIHDHINDLSNCENMSQAVEVSLEFIQERELIQNVQYGNWDAYEVKSIGDEVLKFSL